MGISRLSELELKARLLNELRIRRVIRKRTLIANEYRVGRSAVRADLALLDREFIGVEIKSEFDSLRRFERQLDGYCSYFDRVIIVLARKHFRAVGISVPENVEIWGVLEDGRVAPLELAVRRNHRMARTFKDLLTQRDARKVEPGDSEKQIRACFEDAFRDRFGETSAAFWGSIGRRKILRSDLELLSRFKHHRELAVKLAVERRNVWNQWGSPKSDIVHESQSVHSSSVS